MANKNTMVMDLEAYVEAMRKKGLLQEKKNDYAVLCPLCYEDHKKHGEPGYRKLKLWINKDCEYGKCFRCNTTFVQTDNGEIRYGVKSLEPEIDMSNWKLCKLGEDGFFSLSRYEQFDEDDEVGVNYLASRIYLYRNMYKLLGIKFYKHNPVIPFYYKGELIYYQIRIINPIEGKKYHNPKTDHKNPYILEHGDNNKIIICEGVFDAIACRIMYPDYTPFAVLGSDITPYQIAILRSYCPDEIMIYMDKTSISQGIKTQIEQFISYSDINIIPSSGEDPEEHLKLSFIEDQE